MIAIVLAPDMGEGDALYRDGVLVGGRDLESEVYVSLFVDAPAGDGGDVPGSR